MFTHILYATDFSKASLETEKKVSAVATQFGAQLSVIHVVDYGSTVWAGGGGYFVLAELDEETPEDAQKALAACVERMPIQLSNTQIIQGSPKREIVKYAEQIGADLIMLGSHGHYGVSDVLGTTASAILHRAKCDVMVVQATDAITT